MGVILLSKIGLTIRWREANKEIVGDKKRRNIRFESERDKQRKQKI